jgi:hypothetical protein
MGHKCLFDVETSCIPFKRPAIMGNPSTDSPPPENVSLPNDDDDDDGYDDANDANDDHHTLKYI